MCLIDIGAHKYTVKPEIGVRCVCGMYTIVRGGKFGGIDYKLTKDVVWEDIKPTDAEMAEANWKAWVARRKFVLLPGGKKD